MPPDRRAGGPSAKGQSLENAGLGFTFLIKPGRASGRMANLPLLPLKTRYKWAFFGFGSTVFFHDCGLSPSGFGEKYKPLGDYR
jgi:hypothetical protein